MNPNLSVENTREYDEMLANQVPCFSETLPPLVGSKFGGGTVQLVIALVLFLDACQAILESLYEVGIIQVHA